MKVTEVKKIPDTGRVLIDFYSTTCIPCKLMEHVLSQYNILPEVMTAVKIDVVECPEVAAQYGVRSVPTVLFVKDGHVKEVVPGFPGQTTLFKKLDVWQKL